MCFVYECAFANRILITIWCLQQDAILWLPFFCFLPAENKYRSDKKKQKQWQSMKVLSTSKPNGYMKINCNNSNNNKTKSIQYKVINLKEQKKTVWIAFNGMQLYIIFWTRKHMIKNRQYT